MFSGCSNLKYINLKHLFINGSIRYSKMVDITSTNLIICIDDEQSLKKAISLFQCRSKCLEQWGIYMNKISNNDNICINSCLFSKYALKCYQICSHYYYYDENENKYFCTNNWKCPKSYDKLIYGKNECIKSCRENK